MLFRSQYFYYGGGLSYVTNADSELLFESSELAPYLKVGTGFKLSKNLALDIGINQHFDLGELSSAPAVFLGINYRFGHKTSAYQASSARSAPSPKKFTKEPKNEVQKEAAQVNSSTSAPLKSIEPTNSKKAVVSPITARADKPITETSWAIQLGAYTKLVNAQSAVNKLSQTLTRELTIAAIGDYFKVVILCAGRDECYKLLASDNSIKGFVIKLDDKKLQLLPHN